MLSCFIHAGSSGSAIVPLVDDYPEFYFSSDHESDNVYEVDHTAVSSMNRTRGITMRRSPSPTTRVQDTARANNQPQFEDTESVQLYQSDRESPGLNEYFSSALASSSTSSSSSSSTSSSEGKKGKKKKKMTLLDAKKKKREDKKKEKEQRKLVKKREKEKERRVKDIERTEALKMTQGSTCDASFERN